MKLTFFQNPVFLTACMISGIVIVVLAIQFIHLEVSQKTNSGALINALPRHENRIIKETSRLEDSDSTDFWLNSGAVFYEQKEYSRTLHGDLSAYSRWRLLYNSSNPVDTDNGYHPQNVFRLITRIPKQNASQQMYFMVTHDNLSASPNRNESNGVFLLNRYKDGNNLYYVGIRVDGTAVIKKKSSGIYHTLAQTSLFEGDRYNKNINPNLIPKNKWIGIRTEVENISSNAVNIQMYVDKNNTGDWKEILEAVDTSSSDVPAFLNAGFGGIRTDFMDILFKEYTFSTI
ncbi:MAG: hypothetical protein M3Q80_00845 [bacterium]|nr:hypothetical protein [bacterium]